MKSVDGELGRRLIQNSGCRCVDNGKVTLLVACLTNPKHGRRLTKIKLVSAKIRYSEGHQSSHHYDLTLTALSRNLVYMSARGSDRGRVRGRGRGRGRGAAASTATNSASSRGRGGGFELGGNHIVTAAAALSENQLGQEISERAPDQALISPGADFQKRSRPERTNANNHPGQIINNAKQKRRTTQQVQEDKAKAEADAIAKQRAKKLAESSAIQQAALVEDSLRREDIDYAKYSSRPDLQPLRMPSPGQYLGHRIDLLIAELF